MGENAPRAPGDSGIDYDDVRDRLARSIRRTCPRWLTSHLDDLVQSAVVRVLEAERKGDLRAPVRSSYLWKVAYTATVDRIRSLRRRPESAIRDDEDDRLGSDPRPGPHAREASRDTAAGIDECLSVLVAARRTVVRLFLLGNTLAETETMTGWQPKKVRNLLYRGLSQMRECLAEKGLAP